MNSLSDVHLTLAPHSAQPSTAEQYLKAAIADAQQPHSETVLILNGDILDLTECWPVGKADPRNGLLPYERRAQPALGLSQWLGSGVGPAPDESEPMRAALGDTIEAIVKHHAGEERFFGLLKQFLALPNTHVQFNIGNHERWLSDSALQQRFRQALDLPDDSRSLAFSRRFFIPGPQVLAVHGDEFDPACAPPQAPYQVNHAELYDILFRAPFMEALPTALQRAGYTPEAVTTVREALETLDHMHPPDQGIARLLDTLERLNRQYPPPSGQPSIERVFLSVMKPLLRDALASHARHNRLNRLLAEPALRLNSPALLKAIIRVMNAVSAGKYLKIRGDEAQKGHTQHLLSRLKQDIGMVPQVVLLGHTHHALDTEVGSARLLNTGGHKPGIDPQAGLLREPG